MTSMGCCGVLGSTAIIGKDAGMGMTEEGRSDKVSLLFETAQQLGKFVARAAAEGLAGVFRITRTLDTPKLAAILNQTSRRKGKQ